MITTKRRYTKRTNAQLVKVGSDLVRACKRALHTERAVYHQVKTWKDKEPLKLTKRNIRLFKRVISSARKLKIK